MRKLTQKQFIKELANILGDKFFLCDMIWQEDLHEMQDKLAKLICEASNNNISSARTIAKECPKTFTVS